MNRRYLAVYAVWIALCATLFGALSGIEDPSRRRDRILSNAAAARAEEILRQDVRYRGYEAVHVAWANRGEGGAERRWVVLLDRVPHSGLRDSVVVELRGEDGRLLRVRKPR